MTNLNPDVATGVDIEIIEYLPQGRKKSDQLAGDEILCPSDVRINGQSVLLPSGEPVVVHRMDVKDRDVTAVTLTFWPRRLVIEQREQPPKE